MIVSVGGHTVAVLSLGAIFCEKAYAGTRPSISFRPPVASNFTINNAKSSFSYPYFLPPTGVPVTCTETFTGDPTLYDQVKSFVRLDTYTDKRTGITHVYERQELYGIEIVNANKNLNVRNGKVLSYGTSLFRGNAKSDDLDVPTWTLDDYCASTTAPVNNFTCGHFRNRLRTLATTFNSTVHPFDPAPAAFFFTLAAYPGPIPANTSLERVQTGFANCRRVDEMISRGCSIFYHLPIVRSTALARRKYIQTPVKGSNDTKISLVWRLDIELPDNHYEAYVSVHDPFAVVMVVDWMADGPNKKMNSPSRFPERGEPTPIKTLAAKSPSPVAGGAYRVWKWGAKHPARDKRSLEVTPFNNVSSPQGWHKAPAADDPIGLPPGGPHGLPWASTAYSTPLPTSIYPSGIMTEYPRPSATLVVNYTSTGGNNVVAQASWMDEERQRHTYRPDGGSNLVFDFPYPKNLSQHVTSIESRQCANATVTQYFYLANMFHDLMFQYGFDEESGNFQQYNFGRSEGEQDAVILDVRDGFETEETISFAVLPDGKSGRCRVNIRSFCGPFGNEETETHALLHSLSFGLAARLTGGPRDSSCLAHGEAAGLGMGWAEFISKIIHNSTTPRDGPLSSSPEYMPQLPLHMAPSLEPLMYDHLLRKGYQEKDSMGDVWSSILEVVLSKLAEKHGFADSLFLSSSVQYNSAPKNGNSLMLQLLVNGIKLQPCHPTFLQARDGIIAADRDLTGGENKCLLWDGFASRGLGINAKDLFPNFKPSINGFLVPPECHDHSFCNLFFSFLCFLAVVSYSLMIPAKTRTD